MQSDYFPNQAIDWISSNLGSHVKVVDIQKMQGSTSSDLFRIRVLDNAASRILVLRLLTNAAWLADEPDLTEHEAAALQLAAQTGFTVPEVIAYDADGLKCGVPALLMTNIAGEVNLKPQKFEDWLRQMAAALIPIHAINAETFHWKYYPYNKPAEVKIPGWTKNPRNWERAIELVNQPAPDSFVSFIHRDYHPMNTLWQGQTLSGVVDWVNACLGPASFDAAWMRLNLMAMYGVETAEQFLSFYQSISVEEIAYQPYWDLMALIETLPGPPEVYEPWPLFGLNNLSVPLLMDRTEQYLDCILQKF